MVLTTNTLQNTKSLYGLHSYYGLSLQAEYDNAMKKPDCAFVIASAAVKHQPAGVACLLKNGFKQVGKNKRNPNSGNSIALFVKAIPKKPGIIRQIISKATKKRKKTNARK